MATDTPDMVIVPAKIMLSNDTASLEAQIFEDPKVIAFKPQIANFLGSIEAALYFQQLLHWQKYTKRTDGFFYKSAKELEQETYISIKKQRRCREQLERLGWIDTKKVMANGHPTYHFKVLVKTFSVLVPVETHIASGKLEVAETQVGSGQSASSITKNTHESTHQREVSPEVEQQIADLHAGYVRHYKLEDPDGFAYLSEDRKAEVLATALKNYKLTPKRRAIAAARLKDAGYDMCKQAILRASKDSWTHGDNQRGWFMDLYTYLFKNYEKVEEWATKPEVE